VIERGRGREGGGGEREREREREIKEKEREREREVLHRQLADSLDARLELQRQVDTLRSELLVIEGRLEPSQVLKKSKKQKE
jgi:hypothetical protein